MKLNLKTVVLLICLACNAMLAHSQQPAAKFLKASGKVLRDQSGSGRIVNLRGTNLGSWLSMEAWIGPLGRAALGRKNWHIHQVQGKSDPLLFKMIDGHKNTVWRGELSTANDIQIELRHPEVFDEIVLETVDTIKTRQLLVKVSADGAKWDTAGKAVVTGRRVSFPCDAKALKFIRIASHDQHPVELSIAEIYAYMDDDFTIRNSLINRFGAQKTDALFDAFQQIWITTGDLDSIKSMGLNMVRVPVYWMELMDASGRMKPGAFKQLDWLVTACARRDLYVIIDLHGAPGGVDGYITSGQAYRNDIWSEEKWRVYTENIWKAIAGHYKGNATVAAYDLLNEPVSNNKEYPMKKLYDRLYQTVRQIDPDHIIAMGAFYNFDFLGSPAANGWNNVLYQAHYYNTDIASKASQEGFLQYALKDLITHQRDWDVPVYAGEYTFWQYTDIWQKWMEGMNNENISWSNWCYKNRVTTPQNWSFYQVNSNPVPDMSFDSQAEIKGKWQKFATRYFNINKALMETVRQQAKTPANTNLENAH